MIKDTLYAKYIKEGKGFEIIETKESFLTYRIKEKECFIQHVYVEKDLRKSGKLRDLINKVTKIAKENGCEILTASIDLRDNSASQTMISALMVGFEMAVANNGVILIKIELGA